MAVLQSLPSYLSMYRWIKKAYDDKYTYIKYKLEHLFYILELIDYTVLCIIYLVTVLGNITNIHDNMLNWYI